MTIDRIELHNAARRAFGQQGYAADPQACWALIADMGWLMMTVPETLGGLGLGDEAAGVIHTELGRALVPGPVMAQMLVIEALAAADAVAERDDWLARAMAGEVMTASLAGPDAPGSLRAVPDADLASHVLMVGHDRIALIPMADCAVTRRATWDRSRRLFDVDPGDARGLTLMQGAEAGILAERLRAMLLLALAGDALGGADAILGMTVEYLQTRRQFDRPLAMFQALKHRVADMKAWATAASALFWSRAQQGGTLDEMGALKAHATTVYRQIAEEAIQLHGGIGLTSEHHCHLFLKRAFLDCALGGDADYWEERAGRALL